MLLVTYKCARCGEHVRKSERRVAADHRHVECWGRLVWVSTALGMVRDA